MSTNFGSFSGASSNTSSNSSANSGRATPPPSCGTRGNSSHIASNPTREFLFETATMAEKEIWRNFMIIEHACGVELVDECVASFAKKPPPPRPHGFPRSRPQLEHRFLRLSRFLRPDGA